MVQFLVQHGANINETDPYYSPIKFCPSLIDACTNGHFEIAEVLIQNGADVNAPMNHFIFRNIFHWACRKKHFKFAKLLIEYGADLEGNLEKEFNEQDHSDWEYAAFQFVPDKYTELARAVRSLDIDTVNFLVNEGVNLHLTFYPHKHWSYRLEVETQKIIKFCAERDFHISFEEYGSNVKRMMITCGQYYVFREDDVNNTLNELWGDWDQNVINLIMDFFVISKTEPYKGILNRDERTIEDYIEEWNDKEYMKHEARYDAFEESDHVKKYKSNYISLKYKGQYFDDDFTIQDSVGKHYKPNGKKKLWKSKVDEKKRRRKKKRRKQQKNYHIQMYENSHVQN